MGGRRDNWDKGTFEEALTNLTFSEQGMQTLKQVCLDLFGKMAIIRDEMLVLKEEKELEGIKLEGLKKSNAENKKQFSEWKKRKEEEDKTKEDAWEGKVENLKQQLTTAEKENAKLRQELEEIKKAQGAQGEEMQAVKVQVQEEKVEQSKWIEVVRKGTGGTQKKETMTATLEEQTRRESKARNVVIRGTETGESPKQDVEKVMRDMGVSISFETAWRVGKDDTRSKPLIVRFKDLKDRASFVEKRTTLKGTKIFLDDDLTILQMEQRRKGMEEVMAARKDGKWAVYRDGRVIIRDRQTP